MAAAQFPAKTPAQDLPPKTPARTAPARDHHLLRNPKRGEKGGGVACPLPIGGCGCDASKRGRGAGRKGGRDLATEERRRVRVCWFFPRVERWSCRVRRDVGLTGGFYLRGSGWFFTSKRDVDYTRGAVVCSRSCVIVLVEAKGPRGTRTSRDEQPVTTPEGGSESRSGAQKDSTTRFAGHEREVATPFLFLSLGFCVNDCGRRLWG